MCSFYPQNVLLNIGFCFTFSVPIAIELCQAGVQPLTDNISFPYMTTK